MPLDATDLDALTTRPIEAALAPLGDLLTTGEDVAVNRPGEAWHLMGGRWTRHAVPALTDTLLRGLVTLAEAQHRPGRRSPIVSTDLPSGHRLEGVRPPAVAAGTTAVCLRRADTAIMDPKDIGSRFNTERWNRWRERKEAQRAQSGDLLRLYEDGDLPGFLAAFARRRRTPLICAPTGAGKTFMLKSFMTLLDRDARVVVIEDAREAVLLQQNVVRLIFQRDGITPTDLLVASLRLRPEIVALAELRNEEVAAVYVNEAMSGHPGSPTTIHGRTPGEAARRLVQMVEKATGLGVDAVIAMLETVVDMILPIENEAGARSIAEVWFADAARARGETFRDLVLQGDAGA
jgi:type IV secretion system protein VirB11